MKKLSLYIMAIVFSSMFIFVGTSFAGSYGADKKNKPLDESAAAIEEPAAPPVDESMGMSESDAEEVTLAGTIEEGNKFVADNGDSYDLSNNEQSLEVSALTGKKVEIKGTVMEEESQKTVEVTEYTIIE